MKWEAIGFKEDAHASDIKAVIYLDDNVIATASRDGSVKLWSADLDLLQSLNQHEGSFVNSLAFCPRENCLLSGGNDSLICVWERGSETPTAMLLGHEANVCKLLSLPPACAPFVVASASWDGSVRLWTGEWNPASSVVLRDSSTSGPCWCVGAVGPDTFVTGHADGTLRWWRGERMIRKSPAGHSDVIRDIVSLKEGKWIATCGNDGSIKIWESASGRVVAAVDGAHPAFIYAMAGHEVDGDDDSVLLASVGEEGWLKLWRFSAGSGRLEGVAELRVPMLSVWCVAFKAAGSECIVGGSGGSLVRFSCKQPGQAAVSATLNAQLEIFYASLNTKQEDLERSARPAEVLLAPGKSVGESVMVKDEASGCLEAYQWNGSEWIKLGQVVSKVAPTSGKQRCQADGQEYDFVFKVELDDEGRTYELPYNAGENPYAVAQNFLQRNELPITYLDQVAKFIFTNAGAAATEKGSKEGAKEAAEEGKKETDLVTFVQFNREGILKKLSEFGLSEPFSASDVINALSTWPTDRLFPLLDWLRIEALKREMKLQAVPFDAIFTAVRGGSASKSVQAALTMALRFYCNSLARRSTLEAADREALIRVVGQGTTVLALNPSSWFNPLLSLLNNMKLSKSFDDSALLALLIGLLQEAKACAVAFTADDWRCIAVIRAESHEESLNAALDELLK